MTPEETIHWLIEHKLMRMSYDKVLDEQMVFLTPFGEDINTILSKLQTTSKEAQATNEYAAEMQHEKDKDQGSDVQL